MQPERFPARNAEMRRLREEGWKLEALGALYGVSRAAVWAVVCAERRREKQRVWARQRPRPERQGKEGRMRESVNAWTPALDARLRALWAEGLTGGRIAKEIGRTKNSVLGRAHRLGLEKRPSPIRHGAAPAPKRPKSELPSSVGPLTRGWERGGRVDGCQWIEGDAVGGVKCGAAVLPGTAWCPEHRARVYQPVEKPAQKKEDPR